MLWRRFTRRSRTITSTWQAKLRRGLELVHADAAAMPFAGGAYSTILYATGVIDFTADEQAIRTILNEGRRVVKPSGSIFVAFYRLSDAVERFLARTGLLREGVLSNQECLEMYLLNPAQMIRWVADRAGGSRLTAMALLLRMSVRGTLREKLLTLKMQRIFRHRDSANALLQAAPAKQPYRNEWEIRRLFQRLDIRVKQICALATCWIVELDCGRGVDGGLRKDFANSARPLLAKAES